MRQAVEQLPNTATDVVVLAVWMPILASDNRPAAVDAVQLLPQSRVTNYWSDDRAAGNAFQKIVPERGRIAWDAYLIYAPGKTTEWPPKPMKWFGPRPKPETLLAAIQTARGK